MKFLPIALVACSILAAPAGLMPAHADGPIEVTAPAGDDPPNQVLEIPPACARDGAQAACEDSGGDAAADASSGVPAADPSASAAAAAQTASLAGDVGSAQDYQEQSDSGLVYSPGVLAPYGVGPVEPYPRRPTLAPAPMPIAPFVAATPFVPSVIPATGPIAFGRAAWMPAPHPFTPMVVRPMGPAGMPHAFRLR